MSLVIPFTPTEEARIVTAAKQTGLAPEEFTRRLVNDHLHSPPVALQPPAPKNAAAIALLQSWLQTEPTDDPEEIRQAEEELAEFKRNMNANRAATGERLVFPE